MTETGSMSALDKRRAEVPAEVRQFLRLPGLGPKTAARIWRELGVTTLDAPTCAPRKPSLAYAPADPSLPLPVADFVAAADQALYAAKEGGRNGARFLSLDDIGKPGRTRLVGGQALPVAEAALETPSS